MPFAHITGWGMSVPEPVLTNEDISKLVDTNDEWIREHTGIIERHIAREDQFPSTLTVEAAIKALQIAVAIALFAVLRRAATPRSVIAAALVEGVAFFSIVVCLLILFI